MSNTITAMTVPNSDQASPGPSLMTLPPEIRDMIYREVLVPPSKSIRWRGSIGFALPQQPHVDSGLLHTCKHIYSEAIAVLRREAKVSFWFGSWYLDRTLAATINPLGTDPVLGMHMILSSISGPHVQAGSVYLVLGQAAAFRNSEIDICLSQAYWREHEFNAIVDVLRFLMLGLQAEHPAGQYSVAIKFIWREMLVVPSSNGRKEWARCLAAWRKACAAIRSLRLLLESLTSGKIKVLADLAWWRSDAILANGRNLTLWISEDDDGTVWVQQWPLNEARPTHERALKWTIEERAEAVSRG